MTMSSGTEPHAEPAAELALLSERRRPGRTDHVDPALLPLLRSEFDPALTAGDALLPELGDNPDPLSPARGIAVGMLLSALLWAGIIYGVRMALS